MLDKKLILSAKLINFIESSEIVKSLFDNSNELLDVENLIDLLNMSKENVFLIYRYPKPILEKLFESNFLSKSYYHSNKEFFKRLGVEIKSKSPGLEFYKISEYPVGYFYVMISSGKFNYEYNTKDKIAEIKNNFKTMNSSYYNVILVSVDEIDKFLNLYFDDKRIHWDRIFSEVNIKWDNYLLTKNNKILDWNILHRNPTIKWNFELIDLNLDFLDWSYISSYPDLFWDVPKIRKYKKHIVFSSNKSTIYRFNNYYEGLPCGLSLSSSVDWNEFLINEFINEWDWTDLSSNRAIKWDEQLISKFERYIDFDCLSSNISVNWSINILRKYEKKLNWNKLSGNISLPWSFEFIEMFENRWNWDNSDFVFISDAHENCSISSNSNIFWTERMYLKWKEKLNLWLISRFGRLSNDLIINNKNDFYHKEHYNNKGYRYSDWYTTDEIFLTCWEALSLNDNFAINMEVIDFLFENNIKIEIREGNLAYRDTQWQEKEISLLELLKKSKLIDIKLESILENINIWGCVFINKDFINDSIWETDIKFFFKNDDYKKNINSLEYFLLFRNNY